MFEFDEIVGKISEHAKMSREGVLKLVEEKQDELSGLVSREGAAYMVGRELGLNLLKEGKRKLKIGNIVAGMRFVDVAARILDISGIREFEREGRKGRVLNILLGDETGTIRLSMWNEETDMVSSGGLKEGDVVKITGGYVKSDGRGGFELRLGRGKIEKTDDDVPHTVAKKEGLQGMLRKDIADVEEGGYYEIRGCLVQVFNRNPLYAVCPSCGRRASEREGAWSCMEHGKVEPVYRMVISGILDDGTGNMRVVFFGDEAEKVAGNAAEELRKTAGSGAGLLEIYENMDCLGREFIVTGRARMNELTENMELIAGSVSDVDPKKEYEIILKEFKA